ncbi:MAG: hypothetical protein JW798_18335 [Prolixibacteraceae bacterium]|nr:hypothetical protein [Prolixibacteraceae bacterium]
MELTKIIGLINGRVVSGDIKGKYIEKGFCSDLMSDVLTIDTDTILLITGMANMQTVRTAEMADIHAIILVRNKKATPEMIALASESGIVIVETPFSAYKTCGVLYLEGLKPVY